MVSTVVFSMEHRISGSNNICDTCSNSIDLM